MRTYKAISFARRKSACYQSHFGPGNESTFESTLSRLLCLCSRQWDNIKAAKRHKEREEFILLYLLNPYLLREIITQTVDNCFTRKCWVNKLFALLLKKPLANIPQSYYCKNASIDVSGVSQNIGNERFIALKLWIAWSGKKPCLDANAIKNGKFKNIYMQMRNLSSEFVHAKLEPQNLLAEPTLPKLQELRCNQSQQ